MSAPGSLFLFIRKLRPWSWFRDPKVGWTLAVYGSRKRNPLVALAHWGGEWRFIGRWPFRG